MKISFGWFKAYVFIRWVVFLFIIGSSIFLTIIIVISSILEELDLNIADKYLFAILPIVTFFIVRYLWNQKYDYLNLHQLNQKFKNAVLLIYASIILTLIIFTLIFNIYVLAFFASPFLLLTFAMLVYGCDSARNELKLFTHHPTQQQL
jgi:hypothetical protein